MTETERKLFHPELPEKERYDTVKRWLAERFVEELRESCQYYPTDSCSNLSTPERLYVYLRRNEWEFHDESVPGYDVMDEAGKILGVDWLHDFPEILSESPG